MIDLSLILPVHNEASGIRTAIEDIVVTLANSKIRYEIICVENGSRDNSLDILKNLSKQYKWLHVFQSEKGWGNAVRLGIDKAQGKYVCYMVSDGQIDSTIIPILYKTIQASSLGMVKVRRITRENAKRLLNSLFYNILAKTLFHLPTTDVNGTPKILSRSLLQQLNLQSHNIAIDLELLIKLKINGIQWKEIPIESKKRDSGTSSTNLKSVIEMLSYMKQFYFEKKSWKFRQKINNTFL